MNEVIIDQKTGIITFGGALFGPTVTFEEFENIFGNDVRLIFGGDGSGQYGLENPVKFFNEDCRLYFNFENSFLKRCSVELIGGISKELVDDYPEYSDLQKEVEYLFLIYKKKLKGEYSSEFEWRRVWRYRWGIIALTQVAHSARVVTDILWNA